jgi:hypothetical protein
MSAKGKSTSGAADGAERAADAAADGETMPLDPASRLGGAVLEGVVEAQSELLRFLGTRLAKTAAAFGQLAACRTPAEVLQLQLQLGADAATDCLAEAQRMIGVMEKAASENLSLVP